MSDQAALLLIGHGSRSEAGVSQFRQFADVLQLAAPHLQIGSGLIEFVEPTLDEAIDELVADGAANVIAVPLVLLGAGHMKDDGPAALGRARQRHPDIGFAYARDLGVHPLVLQAIDERARTAVQRLPRHAPAGPEATAAAPATAPATAPANKTAIVLVGRGSTDPDANGDLYKAARLLADHRAIAGDDTLDEVQPAFVSLARPSVAEALDRARRLEATRIAVIPYFLFTGILVDRIADETAAWAAEHPGVHVIVGEEIGPDARIANLILERYDETARGDAHMNCDGCCYRFPMPGYEDRVGVPPAMGAQKP